MSLFPVFVVGSPRSGTSILVQAMIKGGYFAYAEGNFLSLIRDLQRVVDQHFDTFGVSDEVLAGRVDRAMLKIRLENVVASMAGHLQMRTPWLDKTGNPEMIEIIPVLRRVWPNSRFILARRRALENVTSRLRKFPNYDFEYHCKDWARNMTAWRELRGRVPDLPCIEVDQHDISADPVRVAADIGHFLQMDQAAVKQLSGVFTHERPQQTEPGSADRVLCLDRMAWTDEQRAIFHRICDSEMKSYGYSEDESYRVQV